MRDRPLPQHCRLHLGEWHVGQVPADDAVLQGQEVGVVRERQVAVGQHAEQEPDRHQQQAGPPPRRGCRQHAGREDRREDHALDRRAQDQPRRTAPPGERGPLEPRQEGRQHRLGRVAADQRGHDVPAAGVVLALGAAAAGRVCLDHADADQTAQPRLLERHALHPRPRQRLAARRQQAEPALQHVPPQGQGEAVELHQVADRRGDDAERHHRQQQAGQQQREHRRRELFEPALQRPGQAGDAVAQTELLGELQRCEAGHHEGRQPQVGQAADHQVGRGRLVHQPLGFVGDARLGDWVANRTGLACGDARGGWQRRDRARAARRQQHVAQVVRVGPRQRVEAGLDAAARRRLDQHHRQAEEPPQQGRLEAQVLDAVERDAALLAFEDALADPQFLVGQRVLEGQVQCQRTTQPQHEQHDRRDQEPGLEHEAEHEQHHHLLDRIEQPQQQDARMQVATRQHDGLARRRRGRRCRVRPGLGGGRRRRQFRVVRHRASARCDRAAPGHGPPTGQGRGTPTLRCRP